MIKILCSFLGFFRNRHRIIPEDPLVIPEDLLVIPEDLLGSCIFKLWTAFKGNAKPHLITELEKRYRDEFSEVNALIPGARLMAYNIASVSDDFLVCCFMKAEKLATQMYNEGDSPPHVLRQIEDFFYDFVYEYFRLQGESPNVTIDPDRIEARWEAPTKASGFSDHR